MIKKIGLVVLVLLVAFLGYASTRDGKFIYERNGVIQAPASKIFPYLSHFKLGEQWSPYEKKDPTMKKNFIGPDATVGSVMEFEGNSDAGAGKLEILNVVPNELVEMKLTMLKPFQNETLIQYRLMKVDGGTNFSWSMSGDGGFMWKVMHLLMDCEKMIAGDFETGINNLKTVVESKK